MNGSSTADPDTAATPADRSRGLKAELLDLGDQGFSGVLRVLGSPGGAVHLRDGRVVAVETSGAPGPQTLLLKSGQLPEQSWTAAYDAGAAEGRVWEQLVAMGLISPIGLELVCIAAVHDGTFALSLHRPEGWHTDPPGSTPPVLMLRQGVPPKTLLGESRRRLSVISRRWGPPEQLARTRPVPSPQATTATGLGPRYRDILLHANGRRTPRDLAFLLGRGTFAVLADLVRMADEGLLHLPQPAPRTDTAPLTRRLPPASGPEAAAGAGPLPRRRPGGGTAARPPEPAAEQAPLHGSLLRRLRSLRSQEQSAARYPAIDEGVAAREP